MHDILFYVVKRITGSTMAENINKLLRGPASAWDIVLLIVAIFIDLVDLLPFNVPGAAIEAVFLMYLGVPPMASVLRGVSDMVPVLEIIPWCTLTVLHKRFGLSIGGLSWLFDSQPHGNVPAVTVNR
jgi:hypothetical protein